MYSHLHKLSHYLLLITSIWIGSGVNVCLAQTMWQMMHEEELHEAERVLEARYNKVIRKELVPVSVLKSKSLSHKGIKEVYRISNDKGWREKITATIFWVGEKACKANPVHNKSSSWDVKWVKSFGGVDKPNSRRGFQPKDFQPKMNPFYVALPYNDIAAKSHQHKEGAAKMIWWYDKEFRSKYLSVCKGKWIAIKYKGKTCYAQWEDCGPFLTNDWKYVFNGERPKTMKNGSAGIDLSPAIRDYLKLNSGDKVSWKFVEKAQVEHGPWSKWSKRKLLTTTNQ